MSDTPHRPRLVVGVTGASGALYAWRVVHGMIEAGARVELVVSPPGLRLLRDELDWPDADPRRFHPDGTQQITTHPYRDIGATLASGSFCHDGMVVVPCSSNTLGALAHGTAQHLIHRAAYVTLKERRPLILCHRETPLTRIDLTNLLALHDAGAVLLPCNPGFYHRPATLVELADAWATRVLDHLGLTAVDAQRFRWAGRVRPATTDGEP